MIITGSLDALASYAGAFGILGTEDIYCEKRVGGYESGFGAEVYQVLEQYSKYLWRAIMRFDFFLEMLIADADPLQSVYPGQILDYCKECKGKVKVPETCRIVCFPRDPKPHECSEPWISEFWK